MDPNDPRLDEVARRAVGSSVPEWQQQRAILQWLENPLVRALAKGLGIDADSLAAENRDVRTGTAGFLLAAQLFGPHGWTVTGHSLKQSDYVEAVRLYEESHDMAVVDEYLTAAWRDRIWLRGAYGPIPTLAGRHEATRDLMLARNRLMGKALDCHVNGDWEASTLITLSQVDGLTFDFTENPNFGFFYRAKDDYFEDDETVAGMPDFLRVVRHAVNERDDTTSLATALRRHPILHGRYLAYGTETNSAKAFALIAGVIEWLQPKAEVLTERWQTEHEAQWAGSMKRDSEGRLMDRRGFVETRESLRWLGIRQSSEHRDHGRYNPALLDMFPAKGVGRMKRRDQTTVAVAPDGQSCWAWCPSDTSMIFGIGAWNGEPLSYFYVGEGPPGPLGEDERWMSELDDDIYPDWSGDWVRATPALSR